MEGLPARPSEIKPMACFDTASQCTTADHLSEDVVVLGCSNGLKFYTRATNTIEMKNKAAKVQTAVHNGHVYLTSKEIGEVKVCQLDGTTAKQLFSFKSTVNTIHRIAANNSHVYVLDRGPGKIIQYDIAQKKVTNEFFAKKHAAVVTGTVKIMNIQLCSDGSLLITAHDKKLLKMRVASTQLDLIWSAAFEDQVCAVTEASNGYIFVAGKRSEKVFLLDATGRPL